MKQAKNNEAAVEQVTIGEGKPPVRERWPFGELKKGKFFEVADITKHVALRTAASRAKTRLKRAFVVRKVTRESDGALVIRVYRE